MNADNIEKRSEHIGMFRSIQHLTETCVFITNTVIDPGFKLINQL